MVNTTSSAGDEPERGPARLRLGVTTEPFELHPAAAVAPDLLPHLAALHGVRRDALLTRLTALGQEIALVVFAAPVGYGKTTLARQWAESSGRPFAWISVDEADSDPSHLVRALAGALAWGGPVDSGPESGPPAPADVTIALPRLAAAVRAVGEPVLVVLDDLHKARTTRSLDLVLRLAAQMPGGSRLVAAADRRPRLQLRRLPAERYLELGVPDLALSTEEAARLLATSDLQLPDDALEELLRRTEGWPAGLQLATGVLRGKADPAAAVRTIAGDSEIFADYFRDEVLAGHATDTVRFLLRTSVLDRMTGPLCDAALDASGSAAWLSEVQELGLPVVQLEDGRSEGRWYRYHRLFAEMLRSELRQREPGEDLNVLRRAARWYEDHGMPEQAIASALEAHDATTAARIIVATAQEVNSRADIGRARAWIEELGEDMLEQFPPVAVMGALVWALTGDPSRARQALRVAESATFDGPLPDRSSSLASAVVRVRAALAPDGVELMLTDAEQAVRLEPPGSYWHTLAALLLGVAKRLTGASAEAARWFEQSARFGRSQQRPGSSLALAQHALLAADQDDWATAEACAQESWELMREGNLWTSAPNVTTYIAGARVALHRGDRRRALEDTRAAAAMYRTAPLVAFPWLAVQAAVELGRLLLALDDSAGAEAMVAEARRHLAVLRTAGLLTEWVDALVDDVRSAREPSDAADAPTLSKAELRVLSLLPTHLSLAQIGDELVTSRSTVKTQVAAIYRKLDAVNRADAVRRARAAGLLHSDTGGTQPAEP